MLMIFLKELWVLAIISVMMLSDCLFILYAILNIFDADLFENEYTISDY
jgi:hypothetical protein